MYIYTMGDKRTKEIFDGFFEEYANQVERQERTEYFEHDWSILGGAEQFGLKPWDSPSKIKSLTEI